MSPHVPIAAEEASLPCMEFTHNLRLYPGAGQVNKATKEGGVGVHNEWGGLQSIHLGGWAEG